MMCSFSSLIAVYFSVQYLLSTFSCVMCYVGPASLKDMYAK